MRSWGDSGHQDFRGMVCRFPQKSASKASKGPFQCAGQSGAVTYVKVGEVSEPEITPRSSTQAGKTRSILFPNHRRDLPLDCELARIRAATIAIEPSGSYDRFGAAG